MLLRIEFGCGFFWRIKFGPGFLLRIGSGYATGQELPVDPGVDLPDVVEQEAAHKEAIRRNSFRVI